MSSAPRTRELTLDALPFVHHDRDIAAGSSAGGVCVACYAAFRQLLSSIAYGTNCNTGAPSCSGCIVSLPCMIYALQACRSSMEQLDSVVFVNASGKKTSTNNERGDDAAHTMGRSESIARQQEESEESRSEEDVYVFGPVKGHAQDLCHQLLQILPPSLDRDEEHKEDAHAEERQLAALRARLRPFNFVFLGDYIDGGLYSIEVLTVLALLHTLFQRVFGTAKVILLKGRHEVLLPCPDSWTGALAAPVLGKTKPEKCGDEEQDGSSSTRGSDVLQSGRFDAQAKLRCERFVRSRQWTDERSGQIEVLPPELTLLLQDGARSSKDKCDALLEFTEQTVRIVFSAMPVAAVVNDRYFCVCGGVSPSLRTISDMTLVNRLLLSPCEDTVSKSLKKSREQTQENDGDADCSAATVTDAMREKVAEELVDVILSDPMDDDDEFVLGGLPHIPKREEEEGEGADNDNEDGEEAVTVFFAPNAERKVGYAYSYNAVCNFLHRNRLRCLVRASPYAWHRSALDVDYVGMEDCNSCGRPWHFQYAPNDPGYRLYPSWTPVDGGNTAAYPSVVSLFSAPHYCDVCCAVNKNTGAYLVIRPGASTEEADGASDSTMEIRQFSPNPHRPMQLPGTTAAASAFALGNAMIVDLVRDALHAIVAGDVAAPGVEATDMHQQKQQQDEEALRGARSVNSAVLSAGTPMLTCGGARSNAQLCGRSSVHDGAWLMSGVNEKKKKEEQKGEEVEAAPVSGSEFVDGETGEIRFHELLTFLGKDEGEQECTAAASAAECKDGESGKAENDADASVMKLLHSDGAIDAMRCVDRLASSKKRSATAPSMDSPRCVSARCDVVARFRRLLNEASKTRSEMNSGRSEGEEQPSPARASLAQWLLCHEAEQHAAQGERDADESPHGPQTLRQVLTELRETSFETTLRAEREL